MQIITAPGSYSMPNRDYHSQCCDAPSISSTGLRTIRRTSPAHFWATSDLNPHAKPRPWTPQLDFGSAAHALILEGKLSDDFVIAPFSGAYNRNEDGWNASEKQAWRGAQHAAGKIVVTPEDISQIEAMAEALQRHPLIRDGLFRGEVERALFWKRDGYWLKAKPDVVPADDILADYKTTARADLRSVTNSVIDYGYHIQMALAVDAIAETTGREIKNTALVVQEKEPPYAVAVYPFSEHFINAGRAEYLAAFKTFRECYERNEWPSYPDADLFVPEWLHARLEQEGLI